MPTIGNHQYRLRMQRPAKRLRSRTGRYFDVELGRDRTREGRWILDFNQAYNRWCAYSEVYTYPFVPAENWLEVSIYAGGKDYHLPKEG